MRSKDLEHEIEALKAEIAVLESTADEDEAAVSALAEEIEARQGRATITRQALADYRERIKERRADFEQALAAEARALFEDVLRDRDEAGQAVAAAAELVLERLRALDQLQDETEAAWKNVTSRSKALSRPDDYEIARHVETQPEVMREAWGRLADEVRQRVNEEFMDELVEAAATSSTGRAIKDLPAHLQELAKQRRRAWLEEARLSPDEARAQSPR